MYIVHVVHVRQGCIFLKKMGGKGVVTLVTLHRYMRYIVQHVYIVHHMYTLYSMYTLYYRLDRCN
jgi:hypothetical protein